MITSRPERPEDIPRLFQVYQEAFGQDQEAVLVNSLGENHGLLLSLVAISEASLVGGVAFSPLIPSCGHRSKMPANQIVPLI
jgi:predicted N-acetyltransferase YhbS